MPLIEDFPRISIITPSFNQGQFLEETITSVLSQNYPNLEYIIIDGGSTDDSVEIIKKYESQLAYWVSEPDRGQAHAINKGWQLATGDILAWINSDDRYVSSVFDSVSKVFLDNPDIGLIYGNVHLIDENGNRIRDIKPKDLSLKDVIVSNGIPQPSVFIRRSVVENVGLLDEQFKYVMDKDYWVRVLSYYPAFRVNAFLADFRLHSESKTSFITKQQADELYRLNDKIFIPKTMDDVKAKATARINLYHSIYYRKLFNSRKMRYHCIKAFKLDPNLIFHRDGLLPFLLSYLPTTTQRIIYNFGEKINNINMPVKE